LGKKDQPVSPLSRFGSARPLSWLEAASFKGALKGSWSLTVTRHRRLIFRYSGQTNTASDIDQIDYRQGRQKYP
jgi:hypothetical protein